MNPWTLIDFNRPSTLPDADITVMVFVNGEVEMGYYTGDAEGIGPRWLLVNGGEVEPTHWAHIPEGPQ